MSPIDTRVELFNDLKSRVQACWPTKLALLAGLTVGFCVPYIFLAHHSFFRVRDVPLTEFDRRIRFDPRWVWVYQSIYLLTPTLPCLANSRWQLRNYVVGFGLLTCICFLIYLLYPTRVDRPAISHPSAMYAMLLAYDGPYNVFPSLHAGFLYYSLAFARRVYGRTPVFASAILVAWSLLILWATLATKEHYVVDLLAGIVLAAFCDCAAWSRMLRSTGEKSHAGER